MMCVSEKLTGRRKSGAKQQMPVEKNVSEKAVYTSIAVMHNIHLTAECDLLPDRNCIFVLILPKVLK